MLHRLSQQVRHKKEQDALLSKPPFAAVGIQIPRRPEWAKSPDLPLPVLQGFGELMSSLMLGGAFYFAIALLFAAGHSRLRAQGVSA